MAETQPGSKTGEPEPGEPGDEAWDFRRTANTSKGTLNVSLFDQCYGPNPQNSYDEALTPSVTMFRNTAYKEVVKVK